MAPSSSSSSSSGPEAGSGPGSRGYRSRMATTRKGAAKKSQAKTAPAKKSAAKKTAKKAPDRLERYRTMRDFDGTQEPSGSETPADAGNRFVVKRHRARRLHSDVRLAMGGVLRGWAGAKGPQRD